MGRIVGESQPGVAVVVRADTEGRVARDTVVDVVDKTGRQVEVKLQIAVLVLSLGLLGAVLAVLGDLDVER